MGAGRRGRWRIERRLRRVDMTAGKRAAESLAGLPERIVGASKMNITLNIDAEIVARVNRIADAQNTTVAAIVAEYLVALANRDGDATGVRLERIAGMRDDRDRSDQQAATRSWTRDDLYDRPYRHCYEQ